MTVANHDRPAAVPPGSARLAPVASLPALLAELGADPAAALARLGLPADAFAGPDATMSYRDFCRLLAVAVEATGCAHFGLLLGQRVRPAALGSVAALAQNAPSVLDALRSFEAYLHLFDRASTLSVATEDETATVAYAIMEPGVVAADQMYDLCVGVVFNVLSELCGPGWRPSAVLLPHRRPADLRPYTRFFGAALVFDAEQAAVAFPAHWMAQPIAAADAALRTGWQHCVAAIDAAADKPLQERVRRLLRSELPRRWLTEPEVALRLDMDASTLRRRLRREGGSYRGIASEVRYEAAKHFLAHSTISLERLSALLGFSEHSAFSRAFRAWSGSPPQEWRADAGGAAGYRPEKRAARFSRNAATPSA
ncbi:MAG: AraC family transcriptional regulator [Proteobacteria bacterium]|nr:AraC family transcriptional regulator [Pseudomonadota bacterium]